LVRAGTFAAAICLVLGTGLSPNVAEASQARPQSATASSRATAAKASPVRHNSVVRTNNASQATKTQKTVTGPRRQASVAQQVAYASNPGISCVPYVRQATGMAIRGNGGEWWHNAAGYYARGHRPEVGAVMAFPGTGNMRSGHVAVVQEVISAREILIHHANWAGPGIRRGSIMQDVSVVDVSLHNDWSAVRVQVGHDQETLGRIYPVSGFIYDRPDEGYMRTASSPRPGAAVLANARSLRAEDLRAYEELAQAPQRSR